MSKFFKELKRRKVFREAGAYLVISWLLLQVFSIVLPNIEAPDWVLKAIMLLMAIGFPFWLFVSWVYEVTPEGFKKTSSVKENHSTAVTNKRLSILILVALITAIGLMIFKPNTNILKPKADGKYSIAVLPFKDMSSVDTEWFCNGVTDNILNHLFQIGEFTVISRTSSDTYKGKDKTIPEIAKELGVSYIVEGSVTLHNDKVKIIAQLINAKDEHIWSKVFNENFDDIFTIQQNVAKQIAEQLQINLTPEQEKRIEYKPTDNLEALKLFQKGLLLADDSTLKGLENSIEYYQKAIELDPNYAEAYAEIANSYYLMDSFGQKNRNKINSYIEKSLAINPNIVRAYTVKAQIFHEEEKYEKAKEYYEKAIALNPNDASAHYLYAWYLLNNPNESHFEWFMMNNTDHDRKNYLFHITEAQKLDPLSNSINYAKINALLINYKIEEAEEHFNKVSFSLTDRAKKGCERLIVRRKSEIISLENKDWTETIKYYQNAIEKEPNKSYLYKYLGQAYETILNDHKNAVKYLKKAYQLDSTNPGTVRLYYFSLIESGKFKEAEKLTETENYKSLTIMTGDRFDLYGPFYYYYFIKDYKKAQEILSGTLKSEFYFDKINILAQLGKVNEVYKLLKDHDEMGNTSKAFIFASLKERDSMYRYLNKIDVEYFWVNSRFEFDPYRKEESYKTFLKKNYLPITHWNE